MRRGPAPVTAGTSPLRTSTTIAEVPTLPGHLRPTLNLSAAETELQVPLVVFVLQLHDYVESRHRKVARREAGAARRRRVHDDADVPHRTPTGAIIAVYAAAG